MLEQWHKEQCKCCGGLGTQKNKDGLTVLCPCCGGSGQRNVSNMENLPPGVYCMSGSNCNSSR